MADEFQVTCWPLGTCSNSWSAMWERIPRLARGQAGRSKHQDGGAREEMTTAHMSHICHLQIPNQKTQIFICNRHWKLVLFKVALPIFPAPPRKQLTIRGLGKSKVTSWLLHSSFSIDTTRWYKSLVPKWERWLWNLLYHNLFSLEWDRGREIEGT